MKPAPEFNFLQKFCVNILFGKHYFSPLNNFMRKGKDSDLGGPKTSGSGSPILLGDKSRLVCLLRILIRAVSRYTFFKILKTSNVRLVNYLFSGNLPPWSLPGSLSQTQEEINRSLQKIKQDL
jgi:hypothetical protein